MNSLERISENSSPKGSFSRNKKKSELSELSWDSPYLLAMALNEVIFRILTSDRLIEGDRLIQGRLIQV